MATFILLLCPAKADQITNVSEQERDQAGDEHAIVRDKQERISQKRKQNPDSEPEYGILQAGLQKQPDEETGYDRRFGHKLPALPAFPDDQQLQPGKDEGEDEPDVHIGLLRKNVPKVSIQHSNYSKTSLRDGVSRQSPVLRRPFR